MSSKADVDAFFTSPAYAVIGVSADRKKFGNTVFRTMKEKGLKVYPVHPTHETVEGEKCYKDVQSLPADVASIVTVVPPAVTKQVVAECAGAGDEARLDAAGIHVGRLRQKPPARRVLRWSTATAS